MIDCRLCVNWVDENLDDIPVPENGENSTALFFGCKIYGNIEDWETRAHTCPQYQQSAELYAMCSSCQIVVPKVCISMGACVNCLNTDLFCVEQCVGGELKKYCTHFVRLNQEGVHLISGNIVFDLFPKKDQPAEQPAAQQEEEDQASKTDSKDTPQS
jgi:hypothetical protein